jgi:hypothetical protein
LMMMAARWGAVEMLAVMASSGGNGKATSERRVA